MVDTERSLADLQTLFADNTTGNISPQDLRDFLLSMEAPHGKLSLNASAETAISVAGTFVKVAGTTVFGVSSNNMSMPADSRLAHDGIIDRHFHIVATITLQSVSGNTTLAIKIAKNGILLHDSVAKSFFKNAGDQLSISCHADVHLAQNDYIEIWVANESGTNNLTMTEGYFFAMGMFG